MSVAMPAAGNERRHAPDSALKVTVSSPFLYYRLRDLIHEIMQRWEILDIIFSYLDRRDLTKFLYSKRTQEVAIKSLYRSITAALAIRLTNQMRPCTLRMISYQAAVQEINDPRGYRPNGRLDQLLGGKTHRDPQLFPNLRRIFSHQIIGSKKEVCDARIGYGLNTVKSFETVDDAHSFESRLRQLLRHRQGPRYLNSETALVGDFSQTPNGLMVWAPYGCGIPLLIEDIDRLSDLLDNPKWDLVADTVRRMRFEQYPITARHLGQLLARYFKVTELGFALPAEHSETLVGPMSHFAPPLSILWLDCTRSNSLDSLLLAHPYPRLRFMQIRITADVFTSSGQNQAWLVPALQEVAVQVEPGFHKRIKPARMARWITQRVPRGCNVRVLPDIVLRQDASEKEWQRTHNIWVDEVRAYRTERLEHEWKRSLRGFSLVEAVPEATTESI